MGFAGRRQSAAASSQANGGAACVTTTESAAWQPQPLAAPGWRWDTLNLNVDVSATAQTMEGFGGCFNELGWTSLEKLSEADRGGVMRGSAGSRSKCNESLLRR